MPKLIEILQNENISVNPKKKYSEPKIYTGGVDVSKWGKLSKTEKEKALSKHWCVYYSYRNPETEKLERQANIKVGVNHYKTKEERIEVLETFKRNLHKLLRSGNLVNLESFPSGSF